MIANKCIEVDLDGLRKQLARRGPSFIAWELLQNAMDAKGTTVVRVVVKPVAGQAKVLLTVEDDSPLGFVDLRNSWTLFATSEKVGDPEKRGFMNVGEKLALSFCLSATILSTCGGVRFDERGRHTIRGLRPRGTLVTMMLSMTHTDAKQMVEDIRQQALPPEGIRLYVNDEEVQPQPLVRQYEQTLPTRRCDAEGFMRQTRRKTTIRLHQVAEGDTARLYELGIPVVPIDCQWHVDVQQKVLLNSDRDNVTPAYLREIYTGVLNRMHGELSGEQAAHPWVATALEDDQVDPEAVEAVLDAQYGERRVVADPSDPEGTKLACSKGYTVIPGNAFSREAWRNIRDAGAVLPAGKVTPSPRPYSPDGEPLKELPDDRMTERMRERIRFILRLGWELLKRPIDVRLVVESRWDYRATYGGGVLTLNVPLILDDWWSRPHYHEEVMDLLIHELAHESTVDHLSADYHKALTALAGLAVQVAVERPEVFR